MSRRETAITTIAQPEPGRVTVGVDTHGKVHVACALDQLGRQLATRQVATTPAGYRALLAWARSLGEVEAWGVEGTGCYGLGWPGSWTATVRSCWRSIGLTAPLAAGGASQIRWMPKPRLERCWPAR